MSSGDASQRRDRRHRVRRCGKGRSHQHGVGTECRRTLDSGPISDSALVHGEAIVRNEWQKALAHGVINRQCFEIPIVYADYTMRYTQRALQLLFAPHLEQHVKRQRLRLGRKRGKSIRMQGAGNE